MDALADRLRNSERLPALPASLTQLVTALNDGDYDSNILERIIVTDEALSLEVLRYANSSAAGSGRETASLKDAITRVGTRRLMEIALSHQSAQVLAHAGQGYGLRQGEAWQGALAGAFAAEAIAQHTGKADAGICFTAALLRDVGKLAMDLLLDSDEMQQQLCEKSESEDQMEAEQRLFGFDHAEVGAGLISVWELPMVLAPPIRHHHCPPEDNKNVLIDVVHCADATCEMMGFGVGLDGLSYEMDKDACQRIGFDRRELEKCFTEVSGRVAAFQTPVPD